jgi:hypothetical protein
MRDTNITAEVKKRELIIILITFLAANLFNLIGIIIYKQNILELFTQLHVVFFVFLFFYFVIVILRLIWWLFARLYKRIAKH